MKQIGEVLAVHGGTLADTVRTRKEIMKDFWVLTFLDTNDQIRRQRFDNEEAARNAWFHLDGRPLFLDEVRRLESNI